MKKNIFFLGIIAIIPISLSSCNSATTAPESTTESVASTVTVTETDANGTEYTYKGTLNDENLFEGYCEIYSGDELIYAGDVENNQMHGQGTVYSPDGTYYVGEISHNVFSGTGILYSADGIVQYDGEWANNMMNGQGKLYDTTGNLVFEGEFKDNEPVYSTENSITSMPVLSGIDFYTLLDNLTSQQPFEDYTLTSASDGGYYDAFSSDYRYYYSVHTNESAEIGSAEFYLMSDDSDDSFLTYCASLPYDTSEPEKAQEWVEKNIGKEKAKSFGDATYTLSNGENGPILTIKAAGYDEYLIQQSAE